MKLMALHTAWATALVLALAASALAGQSRQARLFLPEKNGAGLEARQVTAPQEEASAQARRLVRLLIEAGAEEGVLPFDPATNPRQVFLVGSRAVADLTISPAMAGRLTGGVTRERLVVWSIVNTLCLNLPGIEAVQILVNGQEAGTLWGHVDISRPLFPDESLGLR